MTPEQLEALIELMETLAIEAAYQATDSEAASPQRERAALRLVYATFKIDPPPSRGLVPANAEVTGWPAPGEVRVDRRVRPQPTGARNSIMEMNRQDAIDFLKAHSQWLADDWSRSPEGREYKDRFDAAVNALDIQGQC